MGEAGEGSGPLPARRGIEYISTKPNAGSKRQRPAEVRLMVDICQTAQASNLTLQPGNRRVLRHPGMGRSPRTADGRAGDIPGNQTYRPPVQPVIPGTSGAALASSGR